MKVLVMNEQVIELDPNTLFFVPFPEQVEEYHKAALLEALKINLGLDPRDYNVVAEKSRIFVIPKKVN